MNITNQPCLFALGNSSAETELEIRIKKNKSIAARALSHAPCFKKVDVKTMLPIQRC